MEVEEDDNWKNLSFLLCSAKSKIDSRITDHLCLFHPRQRASQDSMYLERCNEKDNRPDMKKDA